MNFSTVSFRSVPMWFCIINLNLELKALHILICVWVWSRFTHVQLFVSQQTVAHQASLSMWFSRKNTGVGCHALLQGIFLTQGSNPRLLKLLHWQASFLSLVLHGKLHVLISNNMHDIKHHLKYLSRIKLLLIHICLNSKVHTHVSRSMQICIYVLYEYTIYIYIYIRIYIYIYTYYTFNGFYQVK